LLEPLFESEKKEKILFYLYVHGEGYAREIARTFRFNLNTVQNQLQNLENHGVLRSQMKGHVRMFSFNPRYPLKKELFALLKKAMMYLPGDERKKYYWPHGPERYVDSSYEDSHLREGVTFSLSNPWEKSRLDRFMQSERISKRDRVSKSDGSRKND
jgi:hypothetical protein